MKILVDADGCPVVDITARLAAECGAQCLLLCDTAHRFEKPGCRTITVDKGPDSVDFALLKQIAPGDIVVTQDYGLAAMCLARGARAVNQDGMQYTAHNIDGLLAQRHMARQVRMAGGRIRGAAKRTQAQNQAFAAALRQLLAAAP